MKKLVHWEIIAFAVSVLAYFAGLLIGLPLIVAIYFPAMIIGVAVLFTAIAINKHTIFVATATAFSAILFVISFFTGIENFILLSLSSILAFAGAGVIAKAVIVLSKIEVKSKWIFLSLLTEWIMIFVVLKYGYLLISG